MSFEGQVDWKRKLIGPVWPFAIIGKPNVAPAVAAAAPARNLRREAVSGFLGCSLLIRSSNWKALDVRFGVVLLGPVRPRVNDSRGGFLPAPALQVYGAKARESYPQVLVKSRPNGPQPRVSRSPVPRIDLRQEMQTLTCPRRLSACESGRRSARAPRRYRNRRPVRR